MTHRIVPIAETHIAGFRAALDSVARERRYLAFLEAPPLETTRDFVLDNLKAGQSQFVALADGRVVGWCDVLRKERPALRHAGVLGIGIVAAYRGAGIGAALIEATLADARKKGLTRIELDVRCDNERAQRLYVRFGFSIEGRLRRQMLIDGVYHDVFRMAVLYD
jgi:RimJ/RimL family protein N-acetyltransferase